MRPSTRIVRALLALLPVVMLTLAIPLVNHTEPRIAGIPLLPAWITLWVALTPLVLFAVSRIEGRS